MKILLSLIWMAAKFLVSLTLGFAVTGAAIWIFSDELFALFKPALLSPNPAEATTVLHAFASVGIILMPVVVAVGVWLLIDKIASAVSKKEALL